LVIARHALPPALAPVVQYLGPAAAGLVTGSLAVEAVFNVPGIGAHFVNAALNRDYTLVLGTVLLYSALLLAFNAIADAAAEALDPRIARDRRA
jgi:oligopeptide transport system permease protein